MAAASLNGTQVLIVEDDMLAAMDYAEGLREAGAHVVAVSSTARDALEKVASSKVDVAIVDYALADANSAALQDALDELGIPFVVVTGYPRILVRRNTEQQVLSKPVSAETLCAKVRDLTPA